MTLQTNKNVDARQALLEIVLLSYLKGKDDPLSQLFFLEQTDALYFLLQAANQEPIALALAQEWSHQSSEILRLAFMQYFEKACLNQQADDFKVLGLPRGANKQQIRLHYRQLIKLFHPDRNAFLDQRQVQESSTRINRAYEALNQEVTSEVHSSPTREMPIRYSRFRFISRLLGSKSINKLIFLMLMIGLVGIYLKINFDQESVLIANMAIKPENSQEKPDSSLTDNLTSNIALNSLPRTELTVMTPSKLTKEEKNTPKVFAPKGREDSYKESDRVIDPIIEKNETDAKKEISPTSPSQIDKSVALRAENKAEVTKALDDPTHSVTTLAKPLTQERINQLMIHFLDSYNAGNLEALMSTMSDDLMTNDGSGKITLKHTYGTLFMQTTKREMQFENPSWQINGNKAIGNLKYHAKVKNRDDFFFSNYEGSIKLEVVLLNQQALITGFFMR